MPSLIRDKSIVTNADNPQGNDFIEHTCNTIRFISIGRLSPEKNQSLLIEAFSRVVAGGINASLTIVGDGPLRRELESLAGNLGVSKKTFFAGMLENPFPLLRRSHCLVLPSDYEGQGLVLLEALTLGVFCIGTNIPAVRAILTNSAGIVADPTSKALAEKMIEFSRNPRKAVYEIDEYAKSAMQDFYRNVCGEGVNNAG